MNTLKQQSYLGQLVKATDDLLSVTGKVIAENKKYVIIELSHDYGTFTKKENFQILNWLKDLNVKIIENFELNSYKYYVQFKIENIKIENKSNGTHISDMNIMELRETAKALGLNPKNVSRKELYAKVSDKLLEKDLAEFKQRRKHAKNN